MWPILSEMELVDIIIWYDRPVLYIAVDESEEAYFAMLSGTTANAATKVVNPGNEWFVYVRISLDRYNKYMAGEVSNHNMLSDPEDAMWFWEEAGSGRQFATDWIDKENCPQGEEYVSQ